MLLESLTAFIKRREDYAKKFKSVEIVKTLQKKDYEYILNILYEFLMIPDCTEDVADCFPQLLPALIAQTVSIDSVSFNDGNTLHKLNCIILGKLVRKNSNIVGFMLLYFDKNPAPFESIDLDYSPSKKRRNKGTVASCAEVSDYDLVSACYDILCSAPTHFKYKWNWSKFYKYLTVDDEAVKWIAMNCIAVVLGMSEYCYLPCINDFIQMNEQFLIENKKVNWDNVTSTNTEEMDQIFDNIPSVVSVGGVLLPVSHKSESTEKLNLIPVASTRRNMQNLALAVSSSKCVCLQGPVGSGKTALVEFLAHATGHNSSNFVKVQLGDETDSKMLLGMYRCTDIPGEFLWQPGILTEAVLTGKWLLLEDIDCAATDVASVIGHLVESKTLSVPGYRDCIHVNSGFQLFVTKRLTSDGLQKSTQMSVSSQKHWSFVNVEPLSKEELVIVIQSLFPMLHTVATRMVDAFLLFSVGNHEDIVNSVTRAKQISTRDLIKWCYRAVVDFDVSSPTSALKLFQDALDLFCCSVPNSEQRLKLAIAVAHKLGIVKTKAEFFCETYKPSISLYKDSLVTGRAKLEIKRTDTVKVEPNNSNFSYTRPSVCLLERIASCIMQKEPVLLVGETGTGKTSSIQYLAQITGHKLIVINMNQQSESTDLLGGYKPVDFKLLILPVREEFEILFRSYFAIEPNKKFLDHIGLCFEERKWKTLISLMIHSTSAALKRLKAAPGNHNEVELLKKWEKMAQKLKKLQSQVHNQYSLAFYFVEGGLVKALRNGDWVLLDEINLATAETLECLSGLLEGSSGSLSLLERGDKEPIKRHKDFAIFACMNPATDIGKKDLPIGLRNRFTEFFVDELTEKTDLQLLVNSYLRQLNLLPAKIENIVKFYLNVRKEAETTLLDGTGHKPHYSLRTLCRALNISSQNPCGNVLRSLYEAFCLSFLTQLDSNSYPLVQKMIVKAILGEKAASAILGNPIPMPHNKSTKEFIRFEGYWIPRGDVEPLLPKDYILTETVKQNLKDLVRVVSIGKMPILLQGDTSVGKTSLITYLAKASGHTCVRINNHEHTDLQEYVGTYVADSTGKLVFKEGVLVDAMRKGYWIILDELNLAPSDVLEALNRVLDDNRELFIPETQQVVKANDNFMLFATQNPPGLYGGRKVLSRAFRNRFIELHFDEIPPKELQVILHKRCKMPETYCKQIINVMTELQVRRKSTATFAGKKGFITLRDLFRWGERYHLAPDTGNILYDWSQHLADEGYLVLSSKVRRPEESLEILQVLKKHLRRAVDPDALFTLSERTSPVTRSILESLLSKNIPGFEHVVWTFQMRKMAVLLTKACNFKEPVLLIGETGGGKTTVCQLLSVIRKQEISIVNCHMHTEASDFLGSLRPVRDHTESQKLFEWVDGPLVKAMKNGGFFVVDEISLADDSVLERLNSLLEPERKLWIAEKPANDENSVVEANENFIFIGTMNPGGDYGKKELSPALRNRFTEIWCEGCVSSDDFKCIVEHNLRQEFRESVSIAIMQFLEWVQTTIIGKKLVVSVRDILTWVNFVNYCENLSIGDAFYHGAALSYIDGLGSGSTASEGFKELKDFKDSAMKFIVYQIENTLKSKLTLNHEKSDIENHENKFGIHPFYIIKGDDKIPSNIEFVFTSPTTKMNTLKVLRALQLRKPILLEGSPGVGKTSLVSMLAKASGHRLCRLNLSDQTDISDLFGADLPVEGGKPGEFSWKDGPFLRALKNGDWILLDELNLASQSVLEGLNACLDHRGEVYIPELGMTFHVKLGTRLFGCQNPLRQGGGRRGLPKSFLNRFTQVFVDALGKEDLKFIVKVQFPELPEDLLDKMITFNDRISSEAGVTWAHAGSPWEMNLRDVSRWCEITMEAYSKCSRKIFNPGKGANLIYIDRMRTRVDKNKVIEIYKEIFSPNDYPLPDPEYPLHVTKDKVLLGDEILHRSDFAMYDDHHNLLLLREQKAALKSLAECVNMNWMVILVGEVGIGKSSLVHLLANLAGQKLKSIVVNSAMDTTEILGGFEQTDYDRQFEELLDRAESLLMRALRNKLKKENLEQVAYYHSLLENVRHLSADNRASTEATMAAEMNLFTRKIEELSKLVSAMKTQDPSYQFKLEEIERKLINLSAAVEKDKCLNAGGKFEWVDSVLVKCLQEGIWLLLDQVNLCSPAILDRLNALLEPNGALTIGEKGVDAQGNVFTVKANKNFRLFLTMDPRHGEISRAMRNRGVEISVLRPQDVSSCNLLDLKSLLSKCCIKKVCHQKLLLKACDHLCENQFKWNVILQVASFTRQQIERGFTFEESLKNSCREICSVHNLRSRDAILNKIDNIFLECSAEESLAYNLDGATLSASDLRNSSKLAMIKQQGFLLKSTVEVLRQEKSLQKIHLQDLFERHVPAMKTEEFLTFLLLNFYEQSSLNDIQFRQAWCMKLFEEKGLDHFKKLSEFLSKEATNFENLFKSTSAFDIPLNFVEHSTSSLNLTIGLYFQLMMHECQSEKNHQANKDIMSLVEYSKAVCSGRLSSKLKEDQLIVKFVELIEQSSKIIYTVLHDENLSMNHEEYAELQDGLKWYRRYCELGSIELVDKTCGTFFDLREISSCLKVHYKWLVKFLRKFFQLYNRNSCSLKTQYEIANFSKEYLNVSTDVDKFKKIRKKVKKIISLPSPHFSEDSMIIQQKLQSMLKKVQFNNEDLIDISKIRAKINHLGSTDSLTIRAQLINICAQNMKKDRNSSGTGDLMEIEEISTRVSEFMDIDSDCVEIKYNSAEIEMWPIYEFYFLLFVYYFEGKFCKKILHEFDKDTFELQHENNLANVKNMLTRDSCLTQFEKIPIIPARLLGVMKALTSNHISREESIILFSKLFSLIEEHSDLSFTVKNPNILFQWSDYKATEAQDISTPFEIISIDTSTFCNLMFEFFMAKSGSKKDIINLKNYKQQKELLRTVQELLWRNSLILNTKDFSIPTNDLILLEFYTNYYISAIEEAVNTFVTKLNQEEQNDLKKRLLDPMELLSTVLKHVKIYNDNVERGKAWLILGYLQLFLFHDLGLIDPVRKLILKSKYIHESISELEYLVCVEELQSAVLGTSLSSMKYQSTNRYLKKLSAETDNIDSFQDIRPSCNFQSLKEEIDNFSKNIGSIGSIFRQIDNLADVAKQLRQQSASSFSQERLQEALIWKKSLQRFSEKLEKNFESSFPDLVTPFISAISNLRHGISILIQQIMNLQLQDLTTDICYNLLRFPVIESSQDNYVSLAKLCSSETVISILVKHGRPKSIQKDRLVLAEAALMELENLSFFILTNPVSLWQEADKIFKKVRILWKEQEQQKEKEMEEKQSLFRHKFETKEEDEIDFRNMFPDFQQDFVEVAEMFPDSLENFQEAKETKAMVNEEEYITEIMTLEDARKIHQLHWNIIRNCNRNDQTLRNVATKLENFEYISEPDFIDPLVKRFKLFGHLIKKLPENLSFKLICSLNILISQGLNSEIRKRNRKTYDFYKDPNITEIEECQPIFANLLEKINGFLKEWPDNPLLNSIKLITERLVGFSIYSPLSRFLVGIELLLTKLKQWEENARFDVSLAEFLEIFGKKNLDWRKLEISKWKDSLEVLEDDLKTGASKWWFFLYDLVDQYVESSDEEIEQIGGSNECSVGNVETSSQQLENDNSLRQQSKLNNITKEKVIESLQDFLTKSPLIEFETRLQLIYLFYKHIDHFNNSTKKEELSAMLWNIYCYFNQFLNDVKNKIKTFKDPIAKKLKDTIKITRWNDISYWSVKNTADKTRRTLHKYVKEFQKGLQENVSSYLKLQTSSEITEMNSRKDMKSSEFLIIAIPKKVNKIEKLTCKARQFCENIISKSKYPQFREAVETFIIECLEESKRLKYLEIDKTLAKNKQQAQLKSILQQKKMALANYFKTLIQFGVSYRIGILTLKNRKGKITNFTSAPLNLQEIQSFTLKGSIYKTIEKELLEQCTDCDKYYYGSLIKLNFLNAMVNTAKTDFGVQNAERCHGFSVHLILLAHQQKEAISYFLKHFHPIKMQVSNLTLMANDAIATINILNYLNENNINTNAKTIIESIKNSKIVSISKVVQVFKYIKGIGISSISKFLEMLNIINVTAEDVREDKSTVVKVLAYAKSLEIADVFQIANILETAETIGITHFSQLIAILEETVSIVVKNMKVPNQKDLHLSIDAFQQLLGTLQISIKQIIIFLESGQIGEEELLDLNETSVPILREKCILSGSITAMKDSLTQVRNIEDELTSWIINSQKLEKLNQTLIFHQRHVDFLQTSYKNISEIKKKLIDLCSAFMDQHPITENLNALVSKIDRSIESFSLILNKSPDEYDNSSNLEEYNTKLDALVTQILLAIQNKLQDSQQLEQKTNDVEHESDEEDLPENLLTEKLVGSLKKDISDLRLSVILRTFGDLLKIVYDLDTKSANHCIRSLLEYLPLLEQYVLLLHYYLHEQVASFRLNCKFLYLQLNVFLDLVANGFCQPQNNENSENNQEGETFESGMGLADGEGEKDVSDRIETEDQLEGTKDANEESRDNEKKDMEEEDKGIEMSENFDSHLQDMEKDEEQENNDDDDDLDKEMGETDENADKLNEEIWKDEEEEQDPNDNEKEENDKEKGNGQETGEEELTAKGDEESKNENQTQENEREDHSGKEERNEIDEFDEPEVNDDQIDPYHGQNQPEIEPEPFDLPEDIDLEDNMKEDNAEDEENPFDIDKMKESTTPEDKEMEDSEKQDSQKEEEQQYSSDDEDDADDAEKEGDTDAKNEERKTEDIKDIEKDEIKDSEENITEEEQETQENKVLPSFDKSSNEIDSAQEIESTKHGSKDAVENQLNEENQESVGENNTDDNMNKGTGQSQAQNNEGHSSSKVEENSPISGGEKSLQPVEKRRKPGQSDESRSMPEDETQPVSKKMKTATMHQELDDTETETRNEHRNDSEAYQHIKDTEQFDDYALDAATEEQTKKQTLNEIEDEDNQMDNTLEGDDVEMHEDNPVEKEENKAPKERPEKVSENNKEKSSNTGKTSDDVDKIEIGGEVEGESVETTRVLRGNESTFHTKLSKLEFSDITADQIIQKRSEIETTLGQWSHEPSSAEATNAWNSISTLTESPARELTEKLRLVLEPTLTSRLKGDYRTGRRINMKKVIPYIASEFRKDKIWLRRTKPSKRDYQIVLAIDDSSSMADNHSKELAFESLSLIGKAMTYLEVGQLAVVNFGERVNILHPFGENFTEENGAKLIQQMKFEQKKTMIGELLDFTIDMFAHQCTTFDNAKLVTILSDGRGIFSEGIEKVTAAVRRAKLLNIFLVFIIIENPLNKDSILDIRMPVFENGKLMGISSYMDKFPFPFYIILRDLDTLPIVLSDALRQWFEIVGRIDT